MLFTTNGYLKPLPDKGGSTFKIDRVTGGRIFFESRSDEQVTVNLETSDLKDANFIAYDTVVLEPHGRATHDFETNDFAKPYLRIYVVGGSAVFDIASQNEIVVVGLRR